MKSLLIGMGLLCAISICRVQSSNRTTRMEAEYYVFAYAEHYRVPPALARAIVERESNWQPCTVSPEGAEGLMQLMPATAQRLGVTDRCNLDQNVSGGVRYLAWLMELFHNDLRLVSAAYCAGEGAIERRGLAYRNAGVVTYVKAIRVAYLRETQSRPRQLRVRDPEVRLWLALLRPSSHCHACSVSRISVDRSAIFLPTHPDFHPGLLVLLCYKCGAPQKGQLESCRRRARATFCRSVAIDQGLCRSRRTRRSPRTELWRHFGDG